MRAAAATWKRRIDLLGPMLLYLLAAIPIGWATRERFNSDGVCYLHRAVLLSHGDFVNSISGYWSPGLTWSVVPLLWIGIDPLHAIHLALLIWGAAYVVSAQIFLRAILPLRTSWRIAAGITFAIVALRLMTPVITPDVILGTLLLLYLTFSTRRPWAAGLIAGLAYLGKAYAFPFFLVHFLMTVIVRQLGWRALLKGYLGFAIVAAPWVGVLSWKYAHFTFSTVATRNRFMQDVAPPDVRLHPPDVSRVPPGPFLTNMEVTDADAWPKWSPLDSRAHFVHQLHIAVEHLWDLIADVWRFDYVGLALLACSLALVSRQRETIWLLLTGIVYAGGLTLVVYESRYAVPVLLPVAIVLCFKGCERWEPQIMPFVVAGCFGCAAIFGTYEKLTLPHPAVTDRQIARTISRDGMDGLFATNTPTRDRASCVAFFLNQKFIALPPDNDAAILQSKLDADGVRFFYRWFDPNYADSADWPEPQTRLLIGDGDWQKRKSIRLDSRRRLDIYERGNSSSQPVVGALRTGN